jgi:hypothetical protein
MAEDDPVLTAKEQDELDLAMVQIFSAFFRLADTDFVSQLAVQLMLSLKLKTRSQSALNEVGRAMPGGVSDQFMDARFKTAVELAVRKGNNCPTVEDPKVYGDVETVFDNCGIYQNGTETGGPLADTTIAVWTTVIAGRVAEHGDVGAKNNQQDLSLAPVSWPNKRETCPASLFAFGSADFPVKGDCNSFFINLPCYTCLFRFPLSPYGF